MWYWKFLSNQSNKIYLWVLTLYTLRVFFLSICKYRNSDILFPVTSLSCCCNICSNISTWDGTIENIFKRNGINFYAMISVICFMYVVSKRVTEIFYYVFYIRMRNKTYLYKQQYAYAFVIYYKFNMKNYIKFVSELLYIF